jgi:glycosyltransferase involved in cell wall biosynthesis
MSPGRSTGMPLAPHDGSPRVLFVSHEATRSGAPIMFLHFLRWLRANTSLSFEILLLAGGPLADDFAAVAPTTSIEALGRSSASYFEAGIAKAGFPKAGDRLKVERVQRTVKHLRGFDALYLNSTTSALALRILPEIPPVVFSHIHELDSAFHYWFPEPDRSTMLRTTDWFVACAEVVASNLIGGYGIPRSRVSCHYEFIAPPQVDEQRARAVRAEIGIPPSTFLVGGSGQVIWRKGADLFIQMAAGVMRARPDLDVQFVWVGGPGDEPLPIEQDIAGLGLTGRVHYVGEVADPADLFAGLDVFCLPSREDPDPLVMLEAAALGVPIVSFPNGGVVEFAGDPDPCERRAVIVPYLDIEAMAAGVVDLLEDADARKAVGERGQHRVLNEHTVDVGAAGLYQEILGRLSPAPPVLHSATTTGP